MGDGNRFLSREFYEKAETAGENMSLSKKTYFKIETFRLLLFPIALVIVTVGFIFLRMYLGDNFDMWIYINYAILSAIAGIVCIFVSYVWQKKKKVGSRVHV
jgi:multidrug transporter EmrE-like cation transporter